MNGLSKMNLRALYFFQLRFSNNLLTLQKSARNDSTPRRRLFVAAAI